MQFWPSVASTDRIGWPFGKVPFVGIPHPNCSDRPVQVMKGLASDGGLCGENGFVFAQAVNGATVYKPHSPKDG
eukprot:4073969-Amphidinium_carterae.1